MARSSDQKLKILYLMQILLEDTDEEHPITMNEIISKLSAYGISAERKSVYNDIEALRKYGMDIIGLQQDRNFYYYVGNRTFELAELKLLVDSVQASRFITTKKTNELIKKLESFTSKYEAGKLQREVYVANRIKTMNETIYYSVDEIHAAIAGNKKIRFQYFQWNVKKEMELRHDGEFYLVSPWALCWDSDNYYLIGYDAEADMIKHYRVDKMLRIERTDEAREGKDRFKEFDIAVYMKKMFNMYGGREETVKLLCRNDLAGAIIDRFGKDIPLHPADESHFTVNVKVEVSEYFIHWIMALGAKITGPESVVNEVKDEIKRLADQYDGNEGM